MRSSAALCPSRGFHVWMLRTAEEAQLRLPLRYPVSNQKRPRLRRVKVTLSAAKRGARVGGVRQKARPGEICLRIHRREDQGTWGLAREDGRPPKMNVKNRRSSAVTVPAVSPASAIIHQRLWQKLRVEELRGGGEREPWGTSLHPGREKRPASKRKQMWLFRRPNRAGWWCAE